MCAGGNGPSQIARILKKEQILTPTMYAYTKYGITHVGLDTQRPYHWSGDTVADMLENEIYLGNTVNMKHSSRSYKDKRRVEHPREECMVFENTHPALITREVWDMVQRVWKNKCRLTKMEEQNMPGAPSIKNRGAFAELETDWQATISGYLRVYSLCIGTRK